MVDFDARPPFLVVLDHAVLAKHLSGGEEASEGVVGVSKVQEARAGRPSHARGQCIESPLIPPMPCM